MAADASSAEDSSDDDSDLNYAHTANRHRKHLDDSDLGRMRTATGHRQQSSSPTVEQRE